MKQWLTTVILILLGSTPAYAADFKWLDEQGESFSLAALKGKTVVVHLWASWCPPCRTEMKSFSEWAEKNSALHVIMVSLDSNARDASSFLKEQDINRPVLLSDATQARNLGARALPSTIIVSADGTISQRHHGARNWQDRNFSDTVLKDLHP